MFTYNQCRNMKKRARAKKRGGDIRQADLTWDRSDNWSDARLASLPFVLKDFFTGLSSDELIVAHDLVLGHPAHDIAVKMGVSGSRISQIKKKLRQHLADILPDPDGPPAGGGGGLRPPRTTSSANITFPHRGRGSLFGTRRQAG